MPTLQANTPSRKRAKRKRRVRSRRSSLTPSKVNTSHIQDVTWRSDIDYKKSFVMHTPKVLRKERYAFVQNHVRREVAMRKRQAALEPYVVKRFKVDDLRCREQVDEGMLRFVGFGVKWLCFGGFGVFLVFCGVFGVFCGVCGVFCGVCWVFGYVLMFRNLQV